MPPFEGKNEHSRRLIYHTTDNQHHIIFCPGCQCAHAFDQRWTFNGNDSAPTFFPSMLVNASDPATRCHSFVENGNIRFLEDCFHSLKGKTVPLEMF
jgi:hypothetical protein